MKKIKIVLLIIAVAFTGIINLKPLYATMVPGPGCTSGCTYGYFCPLLDRNSTSYMYAETCEHDESKSKHYCATTSNESCCCEACETDPCPED